MFSTTDKIFLIVGRLSGGKTEACQFLQKEFNIHHVPCSRILCEAVDCLSKEVTERKKLQQLGYQYIKQNDGHKIFAEKIIQYMESHKSAQYVLDGLRYPDTLFFIEQYFNTTVPIIYISNKTEDLYKRYKKKYKENITFEEFLELLEHPVERVQERYFHVANVIIDNDGNLENLFNQIRYLFSTATQE